MKRLIKYIIIIITFPILTIAQGNETFYTVFNSISADKIKNNLYVLADDSLKGRAVGTEGGEIAAKYISQRFEEYNLKKIMGDNTYFQNIPMHGSIPLKNSELALALLDDTLQLDYSKDYYLYRTGQQTFIPTYLQLVFVGYGIVAPEYDYNDYQSVDVENKVVVYLDGEPESNDPDYFDGTNPTVYNNPESKRRIAFAHGCAGTIQIPLNSYDTWEEIQKDFQFEDVTLAYSVSGNFNIIINPKIVDKLFYKAKFSFNNILAMHINRKMESFELSSKIKFKGVFKEQDFISPNIIGLIEGNDKDLKDSYLIVSAHYDHLGIGQPENGDSVYNGALDNAIGVSVLLELVRSFSSLKIKPKRSIIFLATTGEEKGLLGAIYYTDNPVVPLYKTIADVNIDGIAMFKDFKSLVGIGSKYSSLGKSLKECTDKYNLELQDVPSHFRTIGAFNNSDQFAFAKAGIPSIIILEGTKNNTKSESEVSSAFIDYLINRYHSPADDLKQDIDFKAAEKHTKVLFDFCYSLANSLTAPEWNSGAPFINARLQSAAEEK